MDCKEAIWRRFETVTEDVEQIQRFHQLVGSKKLDGCELALILTSIRIRPDTGVTNNCNF